MSTPLPLAECHRYINFWSWGLVMVSSNWLGENPNGRLVQARWVRPVQTAATVLFVAAIIYRLPRRSNVSM